MSTPLVPPWDVEYYYADSALATDVAVALKGEAASLNGNRMSLAEAVRRMTYEAGAGRRATSEIESIGYRLSAAQGAIHRVADALSQVAGRASDVRDEAARAAAAQVDAG